MYFANGITLSKDEDFLLVQETFAYRTRRYWLKGPRKGTWDYFVELLPGVCVCVIVCVLVCEWVCE